MIRRNDKWINRYLKGAFILLFYGYEDLTIEMKIMIAS